MRLAVVLLLLCGACASAPEKKAEDEPEQYLDCKKRYDYYRCCPRDFETRRIAGECFNLPKKK